MLLLVKMIVLSHEPFLLCGQYSKWLRYCQARLAYRTPISYYLTMAMKPIMIKKANKGKLHKALGVKKGTKIPVSKLAVKKTDSPAVKKEKTFAINAKSWRKG